MKILIFIALLLLTSATAATAVSGNVSGLWNTDGGDSRLELFNCGDKICGKIVWLKVPNYIDRRDGPVGKTKVDLKNPDKALRNKPILGLQVMKGFTAKGSNKWENGTCYDPENGKSYKCNMQLVSPERLKLRGYIGISLIGKTFGLTR